MGRWIPLIIVTGDVTGRRPSGRERPWVSPGRDVPPCQSPNRCQDRRSPHRPRLGGGGGTALSAPHVCVGIDVSKAQLDVALRPTDDCWHVSHDALGITGLVERLQAVQPTLVVLEATGGLEVPVTGSLAAAGLPVVVVNPRHARDVAQATGRLAQTASLEARGLAHVAEAVRPTPRPLPEAPAPTGAEAHSRASPPAECPAADSRGQPGAHRLARAPPGPHR
jgi:transposase